MKKYQITTIAILVCLTISLSLPASAAPQIAGDTIRISLTNAEGQANGESQYPAIAPDGSYIAFQSGGDNLVSDDTNGVSDIFVRDEAGGETVAFRSLQTAPRGTDLPIFQRSQSRDAG